jgi:sugar-specific transcriptional regulator TrmB
MPEPPFSIEHAVHALGLPKNSTVVLNDLMISEESKATGIIKRTGLHRHLVYEALKFLEMKGLVKRVERDGVAHFQLLSFDTMLHEAESRYHTTTQLATYIANRKNRPKGNVQFHSGVEGVHAFIEHVLDVGESIYVIGGNSRFPVYFPEIYSLWNQKRVEKGIKFHALLSTSRLPISTVKKSELFHYKLLKEKSYTSVLWIFGDYIAFVFWTTKLTSEIIVIQHPELAKQQRRFFDMLWDANTDTE